MARRRMPLGRTLLAATLVLSAWACGGARTPEARTPADEPTRGEVRVDRAAQASGPEWPAVRPGIWEISGTRTSAAGQVHSWREKMRRCDDTTRLFQASWSARRGASRCRHESVRRSPEAFALTVECGRSKHGGASGTGSINVPAEDRFEMVVRMYEGRLSYAVIQRGRRIADCAR